MKAAHEKFTVLMYNSSAKAKESFTENSLNVTEESLGTKNFASL